MTLWEGTVFTLSLSSPLTSSSKSGLRLNSLVAFRALNERRVKLWWMRSPSNSPMPDDSGMMRVTRLERGDDRLEEEGGGRGE